MEKETTLQERLLQARRRAGRTQKEVAEAIGVAPSTYSDLEKGESSRTTHIVDIAVFLDVDPIALNSGKGWLSDGEINDMSAYETRKERILKLMDAMPQEEQDKLISEAVARRLGN